MGLVSLALRQVRATRLVTRRPIPWGRSGANVAPRRHSRGGKNGVPSPNVRSCRQGDPQSEAASLRRVALANRLADHPAVSDLRRRPESTVDHIAGSFVHGRASWLARHPVDDFGEEIEMVEATYEATVVDDFGNEGCSDLARRATR